MFLKFTVSVFAAVLLAGCATAPTQRLKMSSPANPDAPEGTHVAGSVSLRTDAATRKTHTLFSAAQKEQEQWDKYGPVSGTPEDAPKSDMKMEMHHEHD